MTALTIALWAVGLAIFVLAAILGLVWYSVCKVLNITEFLDSDFNTTFNTKENIDG